MAESRQGAGHIIVAAPAFAHEPFFRQLIPCLEDGQVISIFTDNFASLILRKMMREAGCTKKVIVGAWSSAPYRTRIETVGGFMFPHVAVKYRAIACAGRDPPDDGLRNDFSWEASRSLPCIDPVTLRDGPEKGTRFLDIASATSPGHSRPGAILRVSTIGKLGQDLRRFRQDRYSMFTPCLALDLRRHQVLRGRDRPSEALAVDLPRYSYESFFSRRSVLTQEYMGKDKDGKDNMFLSLDEPTTESNTGPNSIHHRYLTEDVPVGCKIYHELGVQYGVPTPVIDSMIVMAGAMHKKDFFKEGYSLEYLGIKDMSKEDLLEYLNRGIYNR